jgi:hypothetical protein
MGVIALGVVKSRDWDWASTPTEGPLLPGWPRSLASSCGPLESMRQRSTGQHPLVQDDPLAEDLK